MGNKDKDKEMAEIMEVMDVPERFLDVLSFKDRKELARRIMEKSWRHPIGAVVYEKYHRCTACGGKVCDEVVVVMHRQRVGDHTNVFCSKECLANYDGWL